MTRRRFLRSVLVPAMLGIPAAQGQAQFTNIVNARCVGGAIGCSQVDFFLEFLGLSGGLAIDQFRLALISPGYIFASPGITESEDALGLNFYTPVVSADGKTLNGIFDFGAFLDPSSNALRIRAEMQDIPAGVTDLAALSYGYETEGGRRILSSGTVTPDVAVTPEPGSMLL